LLNLSTLQLQGALACVDVTDAECQLLKCLAEAQGCRMDGSALLTRLHMPVDAAGQNALSVRVVRLRKKLLAAGAQEPTIKSIRAGGYQLCLMVHAHRNGMPLSSSSPSHEPQP